jgi:hypothetical protein
VLLSPGFHSEEISRRENASMPCLSIAELRKGASRIWDLQVRVAEKVLYKYVHQVYLIFCQITICACVRKSFMIRKRAIYEENILTG